MVGVQADLLPLAPGERAGLVPDRRGHRDPADVVDPSRSARTDDVAGREATALGGVPNPHSPDKKIPPLSGVVFRKEFDTDAKIIAVIRSGSVPEWLTL